MSIKFQTVHIDHRQYPWLAVTTEKAGILTRCITESHDALWFKSISLAFNFAELVMNEFLDEKVLDEERAAQIMVDMAIVCAGNTGAGLLCTTWFSQEKEHVFLSCGTNRLILVSEGQATEMITPHSLAVTLRAQGQTAIKQRADFIATHLLGQNCKAGDIRNARIQNDSNAAVVLAADVRVLRALTTSTVEVSEVESYLQTYLESMPAGDHTYCVFSFKSD